MAKRKNKPKSANQLANNPKARHDYNISDTFEAGIALTGTEIKSVRAGKINLKDGFARVRGGEVWLENVHISPIKRVTSLTMILCVIVSYYCISAKLPN